MRDLGSESILAAFALDVSHQEVARIIDELEQIGHDVVNAAGYDAWVTGEAAMRVICADLGVCAFSFQARTRTKSSMRARFLAPCASFADMKRTKRVHAFTGPVFLPFMSSARKSSTTQG